MLQKYLTTVPDSNPRILEVKAREYQIQGQPELHSKFKAMLSYLARPCLKATINTKNIL